MHHAVSAVCECLHNGINTRAMHVIAQQITWVIHKFRQLSLFNTLNKQVSPLENSVVVASHFAFYHMFRKTESVHLLLFAIFNLLSQFSSPGSPAQMTYHMCVNVTLNANQTYHTQRISASLMYLTSAWLCSMLITHQLSIQSVFICKCPTINASDSMVTSIERAQVDSIVKCCVTHLFYYIISYYPTITYYLNSMIHYTCLAVW